MAYSIPTGRALDTDFSFTKLSVDNLEQSAAFYGSVFGLMEMHRIEAAIVSQPVSEVVYMATSEGGPLLVLVKYHDAPMAPKNEVTLGFATQDLDALIVRLQAAGGRVLDITQDASFKTAFAEDPEGHRLQISHAIK